eukprot:m.118573 g.118573  ORF g.118573 m.118573 type:complete len:66 (+) comp28674_c0_seq3:1268-1465(+)
MPSDWRTLGVISDEPTFQTTHASVIQVVGGAVNVGARVWEGAVPTISPECRDVLVNGVVGGYVVI